MPLTKISTTLALLTTAAAVGVGPMISADVAHAAAKPKCELAKAVQKAQNSLTKIAEANPDPVKGYLAGTDNVINAMKALEASLTGDQKAIMTAVRKQQEKIRRAVAKAPKGSNLAEPAVAVMTDFTPQAAKASEAFDKLYPAIDNACGTQLGGRGR